MFDNRINFYLNFDINSVGQILGMEIIGANLLNILNNINLNKNNNFILINFSSSENVRILKNNVIEYEKEYISKYTLHAKNIFGNIEVGIGLKEELCYLKIYLGNHNEY